MTDIEQFRELHKRRFPELPLDCGNVLDPGILDEAGWRDWSGIETTPDQLRIEDYLDGFPLAGRRILHVGVGNSGLAKRFAGRLCEILGTTIVAAEADRGNALGLSNYHVVVHNKFAGDHGAAAGRFDFIIDNNPTTYCCCIKHFSSMLEFYASKLKPKGQVVTDSVGLGWTVRSVSSNARWAFGFDDLVEAAALFGLGAYEIDKTIYVLAFCAPEKPLFGRKLGQKLRSIVGRASRKLHRLIGSTGK